MTILARIRQNISLIAIVIFFALAVFILTDFLSGMSNIVSGPPEAGSVAGESVAYTEYSQRVENALSQSGDADELARGRIQDQVWDQFVSELVYDRELKSAGLQVSGAEIYNLFTDEALTPFMNSIVTTYLLRQGDSYSPEKIKLLLEQINENEESAAQFKQLEDLVARVRGQERYVNMIRGAFTASQAYATQRHQEQNRKVNITYLGVNYSQIPDSTIKVSDSEIKAYISDHAPAYKQKDAETFIRYVRFNLRPSQADSSKATISANLLKGQFAESKEDSLFVAANSRTPFSRAYKPVGELPEAIRDSLSGVSAGKVIGPIADRSGYYKLYKVVGVQSAAKPVSKVSHILFPFMGDSAAVRTKAADIAAQARSGADFAQLARENSDDFRSRDLGGDLGWYTPGTFGEEFDNAVSAASTGSIVGPVKGPGGLHVVKVTEKATQTYQIAEIEVPIIFSTQTRDSVYGQANAFAAQLMQKKDINDVASDLNQVALESTGLTDASRDILGLGGGREIIIWALNADVKAISKVYRVKDSYVVAQVYKRKEEGLKDIEDVRDEVEGKIRAEKKAKLIKDKLAGLSGDLNAMKDAYGAGAFVNTASDISFESTNIPGMGTDRMVIGTIAGMQQGTTSKPITGMNGVYIVQVTSVTEAPAPDETTLKALRDNLAAQGQTTLQNKIEAALTELAKVVDARAKAEARQSGL
ncbi:MAG: peptidylprolyl isomerase [Bacteroidia bacterium]|nr:peptidylprolyl isomerase [Bacteroidia bacterium]